MTPAGGESAGACSHCGLPLAAGARATPSGDAFCCSGCFVAWYLSGGDVEGRTDRLLARLVLSAFLSMGVMVFSLALWGGYLDPAGELSGETARALQGVLRLGALALSAPVLLLLGLPLLSAVVALRRWLSADTLVLAGTASAWSVSAWNTLFSHSGHVYFETASMVLVLYVLGRWMDARARDRARARLDRTAGEVEPPARRLAPHGESERVAVADLRAGDLVAVSEGEPVPVDGAVVRGRAELDASRLTGEEAPRTAAAGDAVHAGSVVRAGELLVRTEAGAGARLCDAMDRLLREALDRRTPSIELADRAAAVLLPLVLATAVGAGLWHARAEGLEAGLLCALSVVLISCPCALGIATPLAFWTALSEAWSRGVLVRGGDVFERLARVRRVFLDKTGTLTTGELTLVGVDLREPGTDALELSAALEVASEHPIGRAVLAAWRARRPDADLRDLPAVTDRRAVPGTGVEGRLGGERVALERAEPSEDAGTRVVLRRGERVVAELRFEAELRGETRGTVRELERRGLAPRVLSGDGAAPAGALARELGISFEAELLPHDKVERIRAAGPEGVLFVGDGLNDAAALASADVGVSACGASAASLEAAEVNLLRSDLAALPGLLDLARRAVATARWNLVWAFAYNALGLGLAASGRLTPVFAASAMVVSSALVVLNTRRLASADAGGAEAPDAPGRRAEPVPAAPGGLVRAPAETS